VPVFGQHRGYRAGQLRQSAITDWPISQPRGFAQYASRIGAKFPGLHIPWKWQGTRSKLSSVTG
jgi:hypothetical protein